ncbi:MAG: hypothetical protein M3R08_00800 [Bacteroidota bacterium]|nr:hypothetical protein [Bacteroidota bacterium]
MSGIFLAIAYICLLLFFSRRMQFFTTVPGLPWPHIGILFVVKVLAGTMLWWIYTNLYTERIHADIFKYYDDSAVMFSALPAKPLDFFRMLFGIQNDTPYFTETYYMHMNNWFRQYESNVHNDAHTVIRFNALVRLFSFGEFHVHTVIAAFLSLTGMVGIYRTFVGWLQGRERALMIVVFLLPSVLLWASGVIKESLLFFGLGLLFHQFFKLFDRHITPDGIVILLASVLLLFYLKFYVLMSLIPAGLLYAWTRNRPAQIIWKGLLIYGASVLVAINLHHIFHGSDVLGLLAMKQRDFIGLAEGTSSGSFVMPPRLAPDLVSFLVNAPYAIYITLIGPLIHFKGILASISATENLLIISALAILLVFSHPWRSIDRPLVIMLLAYVILLALVIGWTTPVMGAIVRYRTPLLPFLLIAALLMFDHKRFLAQFPAAARIISS